MPLNWTTPSKAARFILRFDDVCPTMNWTTWAVVESALNRYGIKPLLAVVPDNRDPHLHVSTPVPDFWDRVRRWQRAGWSIALHGYQHRYVTTDGGIMQLNNASEFAGLSYEEQAAKIRAGLDIFSREGIRADAWVAPSHSFDEATLAALRDADLRVISDGFSRFPYLTPDGMTWIPQQLWEFWPVGRGVWTICLHANEWTPDQLDRFTRDVAQWRSQISSFAEVVDGTPARPYGTAERAFAAAWRTARWSKSRIVRAIGRRAVR